jgi:hypothetical protein
VVSLSWKINLGIVEISQKDVPLSINRSLGPFLIVNIFKGLALDTGHRRGAGDEAIMWPVNGGAQQLWRLTKRAAGGDYAIVSEETGLELSSRDSFELSRTAVMEPPSEAAKQRWRFVKPRGVPGLLILSAHSGHALDFPRHLDRDEAPHLYTAHREEHQQFLLLRLSGDSSGGPTLWR